MRALVFRASILMPLLRAPIGIAAYGTLLVACYNPSQPACGFLCGPGGACPASYNCADDGFCHLEGTSASCERDAGADAFDFSPIIARVMPADMSSGVPLDVTPTVKFTEDVVGISTTSFTLTPRGGTPVDASVSYDPATRIASLDPDALLANSTTYDAVLGSDIVDGGGKPLVGQTSWSFSTIADTTAPALIGTSPLDHATDVALDTTIVANFSEQVSHLTAASFLLDTNGVAVPGTIGFVTQTATSLKPSGQLLPATTYRVTLTAEITDLVGNVFTPATFTFTTGADTVPPTVVAQIPAPDDTAVPIDSIVVVQFSESVIGVSGTTLTLERAGTPISGTVVYADPAAQLTPSSPLDPDTLYTVRLSPAITDASGNPLAATSWSFTTDVAPRASRRPAGASRRM